MSVTLYPKRKGVIQKDMEIPPTIATPTVTGVSNLSELTINVRKNWAGYGITNLADPTLAQDAATKAYADSGAFSGVLSALTIDVSKDWNAKRITNLADPSGTQDAVTKAYLVAQLALYLLLAGGTLSGDLLASVDSTINIGADATRFLNIYADKLHASVRATIPVGANMYD